MSPGLWLRCTACRATRSYAFSCNCAQFKWVAGHAAYLHSRLRLQSMFDEGDVLETPAEPLAPAYSVLGGDEGDNMSCSRRSNDFCFMCSCVDVRPPLLAELMSVQVRRQ